MADRLYARDLKRGALALRDFFEYEPVLKAEISVKHIKFFNEIFAENPCGQKLV